MTSDDLLSFKTTFLVVYDYQTGGVWGFVTAHSASDVEGRFPALKVIGNPPDWMSEEIAGRLDRFDIDDELPPVWALGSTE